MTMTMTVLGSAGTHPGPARACSSYLVEAGGVRILLDCGNGSLTNLQQRCDVADVDALVLSHLHPDHFVDVYGLYYALRFHPKGQQSIPIYGPAGTRERIGRLLHSEAEGTFDEVCRFVVVAAGEVVQIGDVAVHLHAAEHPIETLASRVEHGGRVIAFTADSAYTNRLVTCARDADLLICDATWLETQRPLPDGVHMTGAEAGRLAAEAGVGTLLLTHIIPTNDPAATAAEAAAEFRGSVRTAYDLLELRL
jgi:ribonuclease BN (tRNA processing enzyme)